MKALRNDRTAPAPCSLELSGRYAAFGLQGLKVEHWSIWPKKSDRNTLHFWTIKVGPFRLAIGYNNHTANTAVTVRRPGHD